MVRHYRRRREGEGLVPASASTKKASLDATKAKELAEAAALAAEGMDVDDEESMMLIAPAPAPSLLLLRTRWLPRRSSFSGPPGSNLSLTNNPNYVPEGTDIPGGVCWGHTEDTELMRGVLHHGFAEYDKIFADPKLPHLFRLHLLKTPKNMPKELGGKGRRVVVEGG